VGELETDQKQRGVAYTTGFEVPTEIIPGKTFMYKENDYKMIFVRPFDRDVLNKTNLTPINCVMFKRELFLKEGGFDEKIDFLEDWDLWLRYAQYTDFLFIEKTTCLYRVPASKSEFKMRAKSISDTISYVKEKHKKLTDHNDSITPKA